MHQDIMDSAKEKITLSKISLETLHSLSQTLQNGDRILVSPQSIDEKLLLKTYGFQFKEQPNGASIYQFYPTRNKSIKKISSIIYDDSKVSTYKIALLRALVDIASGLYNEHVQFDSEDGVDYAYVPYGLVCFQWIKYYWPLLENDIPQIGRNTNLGFEKPLRAIIKHSKNCYALSPLSQYLNGFKAGFPNTPKLQKLTSEIMRKLRTAIIEGPIHHTSEKNTFITTDRFLSSRKRNLQGLSDYINSKGCVRLKLDLFFEMQVFGNILSDAIAIKWAQESVRLSAKRNTQVTLQEVMPHVLIDIFEERDQSIAREIANTLLEEEHHLTCIYSGKELRSKYDMDHILPYSIFYNNDLWNLVPVAPVVNNKKSDKIIALETLNASKKRLLEYWDYVADAKQFQFSTELKSTLRIDTISASWHNQLFNAVARQADITAQHRGLTRWTI